MKKVLTFFVLLFLVFSVSAQVRVGGLGRADFINNLKNQPTVGLSVSNNEVLSSEDVVVFDKNVWFPQLLENSEYCYPDCSARFLVHNNLNVDIPVESLQVETYKGDLSDSVSLDNVEVSIIASTVDDQTDFIPFGEDREVLVTATKNADEDVEWMPTLTVTSSDYPDLPVDAVTVRQTGWAFWGKGAIANPTTGNGLVAGYHLEESSGTLTDFSGSGYNLKAQGLGYSRSGMLGNGIFCPGTTAGFANWTANNFISAKAPLTISLWFNLNDTAGHSGVLVGFGHSATTNPWMSIQDTNSGIVFTGRNDSDSSNQYTATLVSSRPTPYTWHNLIVTINSTHIVGWLDGVKNTSTTWTHIASTGEFSLCNLIRANGANVDNPWNGTLDEVRIYNRVLLNSEISDLSSFSPPFALWHFDDAQGATAADSTGNGYTGTSTVGWMQRTGVFNNSFEFNGSSTGGYVSVPTSPAFISKNMSFCYWIKPNSYNNPSYTGIIDKSVSETAGIEVYTTTDQPQYMVMTLNVRNSSSTYASLALNIPKNVWSSACFVFNNTHLSAYSNGTVKQTQTFFNNAIVPSTGALDIGRSNGAYFNGSIDEFAWYNRPLNSSEVLDIYESGITMVNASNITGTTWSSNHNVYQPNITYVIGMGDKTLASNVTYTDYLGTPHIMRTNSGIESNTSYIHLWALNGTHYAMDDLTPMPIATNTVTLNSCAGNGLISCDTKTYNYIIQETPHTSIIFGTYSLSSTNTLAGAIIPSSISCVDPDTTRDKVYIKYGLGTPTQTESNSLNTATGATTNFNWNTANLYPLTYNTRGCVNDTWNHEYCSTGTITLRLYDTVTTTLETPPICGDYVTK